MARSSTTFTKDTALKGKGGSKHAKTKIKEKLGLTGWDRLCNFIITDGADKLQEEMLKLEGKDYVSSLGSLVEFVKPKLTRSAVDVNANINIRKTVVLKLDERFATN